MTRNSFANLLLVIICSLAVRGFAEPGPGPAPLECDKLISSCQTCPRGMADRYYTLTARVRLLILWISRPGVGEGRITWSESDDGSRKLALLIGSDPARTPMKINRWGYIEERVLGAYAELVGIMTESEEQSVDQARANLAQTNSAHSFRAVRAQIHDGIAQSSVSYLKVAEDFTYRDVNTMLQRIPQVGSRNRLLTLPGGSEPGFLFAVSSLVHESVEAYRRSGISSATPPGFRRYTFSGSIFELRRRSTREVHEITINGRSYRQLLDSTFEARNLSSEQVSEFSITYGVRYPIDEIPVRIVYRPRWWFEAEMLLDGDAARPQATGGEVPWKTGVM